MDPLKNLPSFYCQLKFRGRRGLPSASGVFAEGAADREETDVDSFAFELFAHHETSLVKSVFVPS